MNITANPYSYPGLGSFPFIRVIAILVSGVSLGLAIWLLVSKVGLSACAHRWKTERNYYLRFTIVTSLIVNRIIDLIQQLLLMLVHAGDTNNNLIAVNVAFVTINEMTALITILCGLTLTIERYIKWNFLNSMSGKRRILGLQ